MEAVSIYGRIDILINNAGMSYRGLIVSTSSEVDYKVMLVNYLGQVALTKGGGFYYLDFINASENSYRRILFSIEAIFFCRSVVTVHDGAVQRAYCIRKQYSG